MTLEFQAARVVLPLQRPVAQLRERDELLNPRNELLSHERHVLQLQVRRGVFAATQPSDPKALLRDSVEERRVLRFDGNEVVQSSRGVSTTFFANQALGETLPKSVNVHALVPQSHVLLERVCQWAQERVLLDIQRGANELR